MTITEEEHTYSGQFRVRLPVGLHAALVTKAERQGVSLNTLVVGLLAGGIGWREESGDFWAQWAIRREHEVHHFVGSRCRNCGHVNEPDPGYVICLPLDMRCQGCGKEVPAPMVVVPDAVDPLAEVNRQFEPIVVNERGGTS